MGYARLLPPMRAFTLSTLLSNLYKIVQLCTMVVCCAGDKCFMLGKPVTHRMHLCICCKEPMHSFLCARPFREGEEDGPQNHTCLKCAAKESAQDVSPPVVVAIKENVDNSSISTVTDLPPVKKMKLIEVATKQKRKVKDLPECLSSFSLENKDWVTFGLEISPRDINLPQEEVVAKCVAQQITVPATEDGAKPTTFVLSDFTVDQLRKVAAKFGCVGVGSKSKFDVRMAMSIKLTVHNRICGTSVFQADEETCSRNTGIRMQNATFHAEHREQFIMSNDIKKRKDFERGAGRNGENLYASISNMVNDCECNEDIGKAEIPNDPTNHYIAEATIEQGLDPTNFLPTTGKGVTNYLKKCIKGRAAIQSLMRESGQNSHDAMSYVKRAISKANIRGLSNIELYYFHERAREVPDMDAAFRTFLTG